MRVKYFDAKNGASKNEIAEIELPEGAKVYELTEKLNLRAPHQAVTCDINGVRSDLTTPLNENDLIRFYSFDEPEGKEVFWHTSAHVLAQAVLRKFPQAKPTIGPPIDAGFYYDFADLSITEEDLKDIEEEMQKICEENYRSERVVFSSKEEALKEFADNRYKVELIESFESGDKLTGYRQGEFFDLCRGPHMPNLGKIKAIKVLKTSGAYWRADAKNAMLTRIYGISFPDRKL